jgi:hypothetical protein
MGCWELLSDGPRASCLLPVPKISGSSSFLVAMLNSICPIHEITRLEANVLDLFDVLELAERNVLPQNYWVFGLCPSPGILKARKHNMSETGSVSILR